MSDRKCSAGSENERLMSACMVHVLSVLSLIDIAVACLSS